MINFLCFIILVICTLFSAENAVEICSNGVFKCVTETSLKICFRGQLVSSEFACPNSTYCSETSDTICTNIPDYDYADYFDGNEEKFKPDTNPDLKCTEAGSFPIANTSCMKYLKCIPKGTGFLMKQLTCYSGYFDPVSQNCSSSYTCPGECPLEIPECTSAEKLPIPNTACEKYVLCKQTQNGWEAQVKTCFTGGLFNPTLGRCEKYYVCGDTTKPDCSTTPGPNQTDNTPTMDPTITGPPINTTITDPTTTGSPINSTITETTSSSVTNSTISEPTTNATTSNPTITGSPTPNATISEPTITGSPTTNATVSEPTIPASPTTNATISEPTITVSPTTNATISEPTITGSPTTNATISEPTTNSTIPQPTITNSPGTDPTVPTTILPIPECSQSGRFPLPNSRCRQYLLCIVTSQGFLQQILDCPVNAYFDPDAQRCRTFYICPEKSTTTSTTVTQTTDLTDLNTTAGPTTTTQLITTTTSPEPSVKGNCTEQGKFPLANTDCTNYLQCTVTTHGFLEQIMVCKQGTKFDPALKKCSETYKCSEFVPDISDNNECLEDQPTIPECLVEGKFPIKRTSCKKYILCVETVTGVKGKEYECPNETKFDPEKSRCETNYKCTEKQCPPNVEVSTELVTTTPEPPSCLLQGRQEIPGTKCEKFLLCVATKQGFVSSVYSCPEGSFFHPVKKRCSESYVCQDELRICSTIGRFPDPMDISCKFYYECTEQELNNIEGIRKECKDDFHFDPEIQQCSTNYSCQTNLIREAGDHNVISPRFLVNGQCTTVGRYLVEMSSCKKYVYCSANTDGTLRATNFTCPTTTVFNQAIQKCTSPASYTCPDTVCVNIPGFISWPNPNVRDCTSYITCQPIFDNIGMIIGYSGVINYCQQGTRFNPTMQICDPMYVCPTNNGK